MLTHGGHHPSEADNRKAGPESVTADDHRGAPGSGAGVGGQTGDGRAPGARPRQQAHHRRRPWRTPARGQVVVGGGRIDRRRGRGPRIEEIVVPDGDVIERGLGPGAGGVELLVEESGRGGTSLVGHRGEGGPQRCRRAGAPESLPLPVEEDDIAVVGVR